MVLKEGCAAFTARYLTRLKVGETGDINATRHFVTEISEKLLIGDILVLHGLALWLINF
jgi:hypothetical protein